jgi:glycine oxidase
MQEFDVIIIGGGVIGLSIARELKKNGVERVAILEKNGVCGKEASSAAAGMLAPQAEADKADDFFRFCQESRDLYPQFAAELLEEKGIDIELDQTGTLYLAFDEEDLEEIERRFEWQQAAGLPVEKLDEWDIAAVEPNLSKFVVGALRFPLDWQVENKKIIDALVRRAKNEKQPEVVPAEIDDLLFNNGKVIGAKSFYREFFAPVVVIASGAWTSLINYSENVAESVKVTPIRGQMMTFTSPNLNYGEKLFQHVIYSPRGYIVPRRDKRILVGATVENVGFQFGVTGAGLASLLEIAFEISPQFRNLILKKTWAGLRPKTPDGLPLLGEYPENSGLYFATGHYRNGILLAPITGKLIAEKIAKGVDSPFLKIFNPSRFVNNS